MDVQRACDEHTGGVAPVIDASGDSQPDPAATAETRQRMIGVSPDECRRVLDGRILMAAS